MAKMSFVSIVALMVVMVLAMSVSARESDSVMAPAPSPLAGAATGLMPPATAIIVVSVIFTVLAPFVLSSY